MLVEKNFYYFTAKILERIYHHCEIFRSVFILSLQKVFER